MQSVQIQLYSGGAYNAEALALWSSSMLWRLDQAFPERWKRLFRVNIRPPGHAFAEVTSEARSASMMAMMVNALREAAFAVVTYPAHGR